MVGSSHHTVDQTLAAAECSGIEWPLDDDITNEELQSIMFPGKYAYASPYTIPVFPQIHRDLAKPGVTLTLLHEEYCRKVLLSGGVPYMYTQFCEKYRRWARATKATMRITHKPGDLLVPYIDREVDLKTVIWDELNIRSSGPNSIVSKAAHKMQQNEQLITQWAPALLTMQLDAVLWRDANEINVGDLWKMLCTYCYLPRLASFDVLVQAIQVGVNSEDYFAYADGMSDGKYKGLKYNQFVGFIDRSGYLVKPLAALKQKAQESAQPQPGGGPVATPPGFGPATTPPGFGPADIPPHTGPADIPPAGPTNTRFSMATTLDSTRVIKNVSNLMDEIINHLTGIHGASVDIKLIVDAVIPNGIPQATVRTVTENCKTLKVEDFGFEE